MGQRRTRRPSFRRSAARRNPAGGERVRKAWAVLRFLITWAVLFGIWMVFAFRADLFSLAAGLAGSALIAGLTYRVFLEEHEASLHSFLPRPLGLLIFLLQLVFQMYRASGRMLAAVVRGHPGGGRPRVVYFRTRLHSDLGRMVLANSITFTPGTITLDLNEDHLTVHWFFCNTRHSKAAGEAVKGRLEGLVRRTWV